MPKYNVYLVATAETTVTVEAENGDEAVEIALQGDLPYASAFAGYELGQWTTASELFSVYAKAEDDYEEMDYR